MTLGGGRATVCVDTPESITHLRCVFSAGAEQSDLQEKHHLHFFNSIHKWQRKQAKYKITQRTITANSLYETEIRRNVPWTVTSMCIYCKSESYGKHIQNE